MPRITRAGGKTLDFCARCFPSRWMAKEQYGCEVYDSIHPPYEGEPDIGIPPNSYRCCECGEFLGYDDNVVYDELGMNKQ